MKTTSVLRNFIIVENFFFINRSFLINDAKTWILCNTIFIIITGSTISMIIFDILNPEGETQMSIRVIQFVSVWETVHLALAARSKTSFTMLDMIDDRCSDININISRLKDEVFSAIVYLVIATLLDFLSFFLLDGTPRLHLSFILGSAAHDGEMIFYTLLIKGYTLKLSKLEKLDPVIGARIYGEILLGTDNLSADFYMRVLIMLCATFLKTVIYLVLFVLSNYAITHVSVFLVFRELKALYSVWLMCSAAAKSDSVCQRLTFRLTTKLIFDPRISKYPKSPQYNAVSLWLKHLNERRPEYITGSILTIGLAVPFQIVDLGISYMLIIVQMYTAFF